MSSSDPFAGIKLSEQVTPPKLDQRLFSDQPSNVSASTLATPDSQIEPSHTPHKSSSPRRKPPVKTGLDGPKQPQFDLEDEALYKATFTFSQPELEALEDLKLEFRRDHDTKITKNDVVRAAVHMLVEDHFDNKQRSYVTRKLGKRF